MRITYDVDADALYVGLKPESAEVTRTRELDDATLLDLDDSGDLLGIEVLHPNREWPVEEAIKSYQIPPSDAAVLRSLWFGRSAMRPIATPKSPIGE